MRGLLQVQEGFFDGVGYQEDRAVLWLENAFCYAVVEEGEELVVKAVDVEQDYGLLVELESLPCEDFEHLFEGAEAAREDEKGVGLFSHERFAGVHGVGDVELSDAVVGDLEIDEDLGDDAYNAASVGEAGFGDGAHEADGGSAVDEADVLLGEGATKMFGGFAVDRIGSVSGGAEDGYVPNHL
jgi:hypothetical protein